jgi:CheY-like chemotaxis protein
MGDGPNLIRDFAHELRNAISPIRSAADVLRVRGSDPATLQKSLEHIRRSLDAALQTIDVFVAAERAMTGSLSLNLESVAVGGLVDDSLARIRAIDARATPRFHVALPDARLSVQGDREQLVTVLTSLLEHARVTSADDVAIEVGAERRAGQARLRISFPASSPAPELATLFDTFRAPAGLGLMALRTARQIVELQHGTLAVGEATGTREFALTLPRGEDAASGAVAGKAQAAPHAPSPSNGSGPRARMKILLVDDNVALRTSYAEALKELGYDVLAAADGDEAIELAERNRPDVALIDIHLPTVNGYQVARVLKTRPATRAIRLVMLSGMTLDETTRRLSLNAGFDDCIDKMAGPSALDALLHAA